MKPMIRMSHITFIVLLLCSHGTATADVHTYTCEVIHVYNLADTGSLEKITALEKSMKDSSFSVSRETGAITGKFLTLDTSLAESTRVINKGSKENSFEAVAEFGDFENGTHPYQFLKVEEFLNGAVKPFVVMGEVGIVTGVCK